MLGARMMISHLSEAVIQSGQLNVKKTSYNI
jgi:hypothetical protein